MNKKIIFLFIILLFTCILILIFFYHRKNKLSVVQGKDIPFVVLETVKFMKYSKKIFSIGTVKADQSISISSEIAGVVNSIYFQSGEMIQSGRKLLTLRNNATKAIIEKDQAKYRLLKRNADRSLKLVHQSYISKQSNDQFFYEAQQAKAQLKYDEALLDKTIIKSPFSGQLGIRHVNVGEYIHPGQTIVSLRNCRKIYVDFSVPEKQSDLLSLGNSVLATSYQNKHYQWKGKIIAFGTQMIQATRSIPIRAKLTPPYSHLVPGMYVDVSIFLSKPVYQLAISQDAIVYNPYGKSVYLYQNGKVIQRHVDLGQKIGNFIFVEKGLKEGDRIVVEGQQGLLNHSSVHVVKK